MPDAAVEAARSFLADAISVAVAGSTETSAARVRETASGWGLGDQATVLGTRLRLPAASAAFVNSFQVHCQEFDPLHEAATVHAMAVLTGALLAIAERNDLDGTDLLLGTAVGVEIAVTLGLAAVEGLRFFRPATAGALGTTIALTRLLGMDRATAKDALGLAYSQLAGTMQAHVEGSAALPVQIAHAARAAVTAVDLATAGIDGPHDVLDGPFGYFELYERRGSVSGLLSSLGQPWRVTELSHKPYPTGRAAHAMLHAASTLQQEHGFDSADVTSITVTVPPLVRRLVARPAITGMSTNYARLCLAYLLARLLRDGAIDPAAFERDLLDDPELIAFGSRVDFVEDQTHGIDVLSPQSMRIELADSRTLECSVPHTPGSPENPLDAGARRAKLRHCFTLAGMDPAPLEVALAALEHASAREVLETARVPSD
jgi:2-methylcitrate dehydratase PrpD